VSNEAMGVNSARDSATTMAAALSVALQGALLRSHFEFFSALQQQLPLSDFSLGQQHVGAAPV
jgi:hypothetical protein